MILLYTFLSQITDGIIQFLAIMTLNTSMTLIIITTHIFMSLYSVGRMVCNMVCKLSWTSGPLHHFVSKTGVKMVIFWNINTT